MHTRLSLLWTSAKPSTAVSHSETLPFIRRRVRLRVMGVKLFIADHDAQAASWSAAPR
jgi:hypothetical protein